MSETKRDYSQWRSKGDYSRKNIEKMRSQGVEVPRTSSKKSYREDMARTDYANSQGSRGMTGKIPGRYYRSFDKGAARSSRRGRKSSR